MEIEFEKCKICEAGDLSFGEVFKYDNHLYMKGSIYNFKEIFIDLETGKLNEALQLNSKVERVNAKLVVEE